MKIQLDSVPLSPYDGEQPIGIFDSGVGGLSVWIEIKRLLPNESTLYFADQVNVPYGNKSLQEIREYATSITDFLLSKGAKLIVVACNTASGAALQFLRETFPQTHFVGMEPAVKPAAEKTKTGHVGVIATPMAFEGVLYKKLAQRFGREVTIHTQVCPGLVDAIELGHTTTPATEKLLLNCLQPLAQQNIDHLVLGCTHFPFIAPLAKRILGQGVTLIDPAPAVARQTQRILLQKSILQQENTTGGNHLFCTTGSVKQLRHIAEALVGYTGNINGVDLLIDRSDHNDQIIYKGADLC